jgi:hypothetical protein
LEAVLIAAMPYIGVVDTAKAFEKNPADYKTLEAYSGILAQLQGTGKDGQKAHYEAYLMKTPAAIAAELAKSKKDYGKTLAEKVKEGFDGFVNELGGDYLIGCALEISGANKRAEQAMQYLKEGDSEKLRKMYVETFTEPGAKNQVANLPIDALRILAPLHFSLSQSRFIEQFVSGEGDDKKIDLNKLKEYITNEVNKKEKDEDKDKAYQQIGEAAGRAHAMIQAKLAEEAAESK